MAEVARLRSLLFAPASRPDMLVKLPRSGPDGVVVDLEDAVPAASKAEARPHAYRAGAELATANPGLAVYVRVNPIASPWFASDIGDGCSPELAGVVVPKIETGADVDVVAEALRDAGLAHLHVIVGIETTRGVDAVSELLHGPVAACYFGAEDYVADLGGVRTESNTEVLYPRSRVALAARIAGILAIDQVVTVFGDDDRFLADAVQGRALGYRGKLCIHPAQVPLANRAFSPTPEEINRARRLLAAYAAANARGEAVIDFDGQMVDEPLARHARGILSAGET